MKPAASTHGASQVELLREAISRHSPLALSCRVSDGWSGFYSKFLDERTAEQAIVLEYPWCEGAHIPELVTGQTLGISFRRGPKRCVFSSNVIATRRLKLGDVEVPAILVQWPEQIFELQRRLDYRAPAPTEFHIDVTLRRQSRPGDACETALTAQLADISAGGISVAFPSDENPHWNDGDVIECTFRPSADRDPFDLVTRVRYALRTRDSFRIGLQWYGLEATEAGRETLDRILDLCSEYQQIEMQKLGLCEPH